MQYNSNDHHMADTSFAGAAASAAAYCNHHNDNIHPPTEVLVLEHNTRMIQNYSTTTTTTTTTNSNNNNNAPGCGDAAAAAAAAAVVDPCDSPLSSPPNTPRRSPTGSPVVAIHTAAATTTNTAAAAAAAAVADAATAEDSFLPKRHHAFAAATAATPKSLPFDEGGGGGGTASTDLDHLELLPLDEPPQLSQAVAAAAAPPPPPPPQLISSLSSKTRNNNSNSKQQPSAFLRPSWKKPPPRPYIEKRVPGVVSSSSSNHIKQRMMTPTTTTTTTTIDDDDDEQPHDEKEEEQQQPHDEVSTTTTTPALGHDDDSQPGALPVVANIRTLQKQQQQQQNDSAAAAAAAAAATVNAATTAVATAATATAVAAAATATAATTKIDPDDQSQPDDEMLLQIHHQHHHHLSNVSKSKSSNSSNKSPTVTHTWLSHPTKNNSNDNDTAADADADADQPDDEISNPQNHHAVPDTTTTTTMTTNHGMNDNDVVGTNKEEEDDMPDDEVDHAAAAAAAASGVNDDNNNSIHHNPAAATTTTLVTSSIGSTNEEIEMEIDTAAATAAAAAAEVATSITTNEDMKVKMVNSNDDIELEIDTSGAADADATAVVVPMTTTDALAVSDNDDDIELVLSPTDEQHGFWNDARDEVAAVATPTTPPPRTRTTEQPKLQQEAILPMVEEDESKVESKSCAIKSQEAEEDADDDDDYDDDNDNVEGEEEDDEENDDESSVSEVVVSNSPLRGSAMDPFQALADAATGLSKMVGLTLSDDDKGDGDDEEEDGVDDAADNNSSNVKDSSEEDESTRDATENKEAIYTKTVVETELENDHEEKKIASEPLEGSEAELEPGKIGMSPQRSADKTLDKWKQEIATLKSPKREGIDRATASQSGISSPLSEPLALGSLELETEESPAKKEPSSLATYNVPSTEEEPPSLRRSPQPKDDFAATSALHPVVDTVVEFNSKAINRAQDPDAAYEHDDSDVEAADDLRDALKTASEELGDGISGSQRVEITSSDESPYNVIDLASLTGAASLMSGSRQSSRMTRDPDAMTDGLPVQVSSLNNDIGIPSGDIMVSMLNDSEDQPWSERIKESVWRCRTMRRSSDTKWLRWMLSRKAGEPARGRTSIPVDADDARVVGGIASLSATESAAIEHLKFDELDDALSLYEDIVDCYQTFADDLGRNKKDVSSQERFELFRPYIGTALHNIGIVHMLRGDFEAALKAFEVATKNRESFLGAGHVDHVSSLSRLAVCKFALQDFEEARRDLRNALVLARAKFEEDSLSCRRQLAEIINNIACLSYICDEPKHVLPLLQESLEIQMEISNHSLYIGSKFASQTSALNMTVTKANMGFLALVSRNIPQAVEFFEAAAKEQTLLLRDAHSTLTSTMDHLAVAHLLGENWEKAQQIIKRMLHMERDAFGPNDRRCRIAANKLEMMDDNEGRKKLDAALRAIPSIKARFGKEKKSFLKALNPKTKKKKGKAGYINMQT